ncbi:MAG TPA: tRNA lysidine(34) synthetase TilS [Pelagibacterium sp.]|uniref:tRNA lysidine(34) synthetase TilS n=1 Tax=Pelagibacterium sp. TaxID=1967288 RepID=UPI002C4E1FD6|nr:tRNA lysidine(34) synthetase TilS [Pelagibacterium sp.]HWJ86935.1 tRNA lysidine(34) synthetase TilS [Pelagibacterium sp.]
MLIPDEPALDPAALFAPIAHLHTIGLAISGGADSLALMLLYARWMPSGTKPRAIVYTLDHGLRSEAKDEAEMVMCEAGRLGLEARALHWDGSRFQTRRQQEARAARYRLIGDAMRADSAQVLLTAHHQRDQAETVLMRLARGSGTTGLGAMHPFSCVDGVNIFRPLLDVPAETLFDLVQQAGLSPAVDPSNADPAYERVRWRQALPEFAALGLDEAALALVARRARRIDGLAERLVDQFIAKHLSLDSLGIVRVDRAALEQADAEIIVRVIGRMIEIASGQRCDALASIEALAGRLAEEKSFAATLAGASLVANDNGVMVSREAGRMNVALRHLAAGERCFWDGRFDIAASVPVVIAPGADLTRAQYKASVGGELSGPVAALRAAPVISTPDGTILAIGAHVVGDGVAVSQPTLTSSLRSCRNRTSTGAAALVSPE